MINRGISFICLCAVGMSLIGITNSAFVLADGPKVFMVGPDGKAVAVPGTAGVTPGGAPSGSPPPPPDENKTPGEEEGKKDEKEPPEPKVIRRGEVVDATGDPEELEVKLGDDGKVAFQFRNQSWDDLVEWLAMIADQPLDWLELPGDRVNLATPGRYTVSETKDLFNRHLLARGYTILEMDGGMTVTSTEKINPSMVPRVSVAELVKLQPHTFVRTSLDVGWLSADKLAEELAAMISSNGRLTALSTTNRIEGMDAASNLQDIAKVLETERDSDSVKALAPEFELRYLPAEEAKVMLETFLGVQKKQSGPMSPQQMQMMQQQMRNQGNKGAAPQKKVEISIVANVRRNSIFIRAPVDRIAAAMQFLKQIDLPSDSAAISLTDIQSRFQVFRLTTIDPKELIEIIQDMNILEPGTRVRADKDNNALIVSGSIADRYIINSLIERLDGTGRSFHVLQLRRLDAGDVAESISFLMGQKKEEDDSSSRSRYRYYGYYGGGNEEEKKEKDEFRVAANARFRQVLLWADEGEMKQVESLLVKLGEIPPREGSSRTMRMIDAGATPDTYEYLRRLQQQWQATSSSPLELPDQKEFKDPLKDDEKADVEGEDAKAKKEADADDAELKPELDAPEGNLPPASDENVTKSHKRKQFHFAVMKTPDQPTSDQQKLGAQADASDDSLDDAQSKATIESPVRSARDFDRVFGNKPKEQPAKKPDGSGAPIRIEIDSQGNLVLLSRDTKALDQLENMMLQFKPPRRPYTVFKITHASAYWVKLNLEEYFKNEDDDKDSNADSFYSWYWDMDDEEDEGPSGLGKGNKLRFVDDPDTNTIVVSGATGEQLRTIRELVELWDVEEPSNKRRMRFTDLIQVKYGQAAKISETVKEAYRDLLSSNDKSFARGGGRQNAGGGSAAAQKGAPRKREGNGSGLQDNQNGNDGGGADFSFKGKLSIGVDEVGNTLLISAEGEGLLKLVTDMVEKLDVAAGSSAGVEVVRLPGNLSNRSLQEALKTFGVETKPITSQRTGASKEAKQ